MGRKRSEPRPEESPGETLEELLECEPLNPEQMGAAAERLLRDPAFSLAMEKSYTRCFAEWQEAESVEGRETAHAKLCALKIVETELEVLVNSGILERAKAAPAVY